MFNKKNPFPRPVIGHNADWQYPAITEKHAYLQALTSLPYAKHACYFGFPWATLIDHVTLSRPTALLDQLKNFRDILSPYKHVVTVCQHIYMLKCPELFSETGITDVFWSHAQKGEHVIPGTHIKIHPFPLYPVVQIRPSFWPFHRRKHLFSFVGSKANRYYLTDTRNIIIDQLRSDPRGKIIARDTWHFNRIVYDVQILKRAENVENPLTNTEASEYKHILKDSLFSLCPSGSGPNSIRLWESILCGTIPVVLSDHYQPPGDQTLWEEAIITCPESPKEISALPDRLEKLSRHSHFIQKKHQALKKLARLYGPSCFIHDIQAQFATYTYPPDAHLTSKG